MKLYNIENTNEWVKKIEYDLEAFLGPDKKHLLYLPAGETPRPLYANWKKQSPAYLKNCQFLQIDEILDGNEVFAQFFNDELGSNFDVQKFTKGEAQADVALLGLGLNGHVGFHEPGLTKEFYSGCVPLSKETQAQLKLHKNCWGSTYGLSAFLKCKKIFLLIRGEK